ncbi:unknown [Firmicutes bacterium CAG:791]|nr:unknown [Firmicutes bacterium CAG:791]
MPMVADDHDLLAFFACLVNDLMNLFDKGAGGVHNPRTGPVQILPGFLRNTVRANDNGAALLRSCLFHGIQNSDSLFLQLLYHILIVNDRAEGIDGAILILLNFLVYRVHRILYAEAKACCRSRNHAGSSKLLRRKVQNRLCDLINAKLRGIHKNGILRLLQGRDLAGHIPVIPLRDIRLDLLQIQIVR